MGNANCHQVEPQKKERNFSNTNVWDRLKSGTQISLRRDLNSLASPFGLSSLQTKAFEWKIWRLICQRSLGTLEYGNRYENHSTVVVHNRFVDTLRQKKRKETPKENGTLSVFECEFVFRIVSIFFVVIIWYTFWFVVCVA